MKTNNNAIAPSASPAPCPTCTELRRKLEDMAIELLALRTAGRAANLSRNRNVKLPPKLGARQVLESTLALDGLGRRVHLVAGDVVCGPENLEACKAALPGVVVHGLAPAAIAELQAESLIGVAS